MENKTLKEGEKDTPPPPHKTVSYFVKSSIPLVFILFTIITLLLVEGTFLHDSSSHGF
jgi:hypothetical protein